MSTGKLALIIVGILAFFIVILTGVILEEAGERREMQSCVAAGKDWHHKYGDVYECV